MGALTAGKTVADSVYAYRFIRLMQKNFSEWEAFKTGVIDERGNVIKRPKSDEEKSSYTPFHGAVRALKKMVSTVPGATTWSTISGSISAIGSRFSLTEDEMQIMREGVEPLYESMVAGDSGGNPTNIASGTSSGAITNKGPGHVGITKVKKRKRLSEIYDALE
ncbi:hypothetical protein Acj9p066 [Acinetobacter phage Acj9]|uniref:Uncharacterized protein 61.1 n=1 Tax=Acinetobacter phage Acj9 TaxID=760939 RepID=E5EPK0_9CAUD|nr:hypothetical protein Acj9p066 [Acinetobacter phage Acj9]ADG59966.1 conserved hypothetical protein [Acinetobacter phage Acj9]